MESEKTQPDSNDFDYNDSLKTLTVAITAQIPQIGFIISGLLSIFWPEAKQDVWDQIKDRVKSLVDQQIMKYATSERKHELDSIKDKLQCYQQAKGDQKGNQLTVILSNLGNLYQKLTDQDRRKFYLPLISLTGSLHLLVLMQRLNHGKEIYNIPNEKYWLNQLIRYDEFYRNLMDISFIEWKQWFKDQIKMDVGSSYAPLIYRASYGKVNNPKTNQQVSFSQPSYGSDNYFQSNCIMVRQRMVNEAVNSMIPCLISFYFVSKCLKINNNSLKLPDYLTSFQLGPYADDLSNGSSRQVDLKLQDCKILSDASKIEVRYYNSIDGIGFQGHDQKKFVGNEKGGISTTFDIKNAKGFNMNGMTLQLSNGVCAAIIIHYQDGNDVTGLGNFGKWNHYDILVKSMTPYFLLNGAQLAYGNGYQSSINGIKVVKLFFKYRPEQL